MLGRCKVERATLAFVRASGLAEDLGEHAGGIDTAGDQVAMVPVRRVGDVPGLEQRERRHPGRLLPDVDVEVSDVVLVGQPDQRLLEAAYPEHGSELLDERAGGHSWQHASLYPSLS
jgi:hypothetical protein